MEEQRPHEHIHWRRVTGKDFGSNEGHARRMEKRAYGTRREFLHSSTQGLDYAWLGGILRRLGLNSSGIDGRMDDFLHG